LCVLLAVITPLAEAVWGFGPDPPARTATLSRAPAAALAPVRAAEAAARMDTVAELTRAVEAHHELFHIVMIYRARMKTEPLCTVESLVRSLDESHLTKPATVVLWVYNKAQMISDHPEFFQRLGDFVAEAMRSIHVAWQEVTMEGIFHDTAFQRFYETHNDTQLGKYGEQNKANALRLAVVWKYGGMYMDADMVLLRDPTLLPLGMSTQMLYGKNRYNNAAFKFPRGFPILRYYMDEFVTNYHGSTWGWQGPRLVTRVNFDRCPHKDKANTLYLKPDQRLTRYQTKKINKECLWRDWKLKAATHFLYMKGKTSLDIRQLFVTDEKHALENCTRFQCLREAVGMNHPSIFIIHLWHKLSIEADRELCSSTEDEARYAELPIAMLRQLRCPVVARLLRKGDARCDM